MESQKEQRDPTEFLESVKIDLFGDEVYVFTPQGDVKALPKGACPIDFAYAVHSNIGDHCSGARVNGMIVPLRYQLRNGDTVEIITSPNQKPNKDWLKLVKTARAHEDPLAVAPGAARQGGRARHGSRRQGAAQARHADVARREGPRGRGEGAEVPDRRRADRPGRLRQDHDAAS